MIKQFEGHVMSEEELLQERKRETVAKFEDFIDFFLKSKEYKKASLILYWVNNYINYILKEDDFSPSKLKSYQRGDIVKVDLGFRIGNEEGGLHYAVVLDNDNPLSSGIITILPLTSVKKDTDLENLPNSSLYLGNEIYNSLNSKATTIINLLNKQLDDYAEKENIELDEKDKILKNIQSLQRMSREISKMKRGSIALTNQITTVSKMRIYDPKNKYSVLHGIKLSNTNLDKIDDVILSMFTKNNNKKNN